MKIFLNSVPNNLSLLYIDTYGMASCVHHACHCYKHTSNHTMILQYTLELELLVCAYFIVSQHIHPTILTLFAQLCRVKHVHAWGCLPVA